MECTKGDFWLMKKEKIEFCNEKEKKSLVRCDCGWLILIGAPAKKQLFTKSRSWTEWNLELNVGPFDDKLTKALVAAEDHTIHK